MAYTSSFDDDDTPLVEAVIKDAPKIDALDRRYLNIAQTVVNAAKKGNKAAKNLVTSILREYREWKQAQNEVPFFQQQYDAWNGRASGWEMMLHSQGVSGDDLSFHQPRRNVMGFEIVGGHKSDLDPREKKHLGGYGGDEKDRFSHHGHGHRHRGHAHVVGLHPDVVGLHDDHV